MNKQSISNEATMRNQEPVSMGDMPTSGREAVLGVIDRYELISELGGGGFGSVYLARDSVADVLVAVKGLPPLVKNIPEELERIRANFALVSQLSHPTIAGLKVLHLTQRAVYHDRSVKEKLRVMPGDYLVVMEYAKGVTLSQWKRQFKDGRVPYDLAVEICRQVAEALDYAHAQKIVHRDIKPSNVMVASLLGDSSFAKATADMRESDGLGVRGKKQKPSNSLQLSPTPSSSLNIKVLDFGLAAEIRSSMSRVSKESGDTSGTRPYMAPEQWAGKKQGAATDQYALAVLFYELVSGAVPFASAFDTGDPVVMSNAVLNLKPETAEGLSKKKSAALLRGLAKEPGERFGSCGEFVGAIAGNGGSSKVLKFGSSKVGGGASQVKRVAAALLVLGLVSVASIYSIKSINSKKDEAAARAEQAELDAAKQAQAKALKDKVESALSAGDLKAAGAGIAELEQVAGAATAKSLSERYQGLADERETNKRYAETSVKRDGIEKLERGQGFGVKLDALEVRWREAEAAREGKAWGQALSCYDAVLAECQTLGESDISRKGAEAQRNEAEQVRAAAESANAATDAPEQFKTGGRDFVRAAEAFEKGDFPAATSAWQDAAKYYTAAKTQALHVQAYRKAKTVYEAELGGRDSVRAVLLETHGKVKWGEVKKSALQGAASGNDPVEGAKAYERALAALPEAVKEAEAIKAAADERARIAKAAADEQARIEAVEKALAEAGKAKVAKDWEGVKKLLDNLAVTPAEVGKKSSELTESIKTLLAEAEANLEPKLKLSTLIGGQEVPGAKVTCGSKSFVTPVTLTLEKGGRYEFAVAAFEHGGKRYKEESITKTADWSGAEDLEIPLEEIIGPAPGEKRSVDLGGGVAMDLMPIRAGSFDMGSNNGDDDEKPVHRVTLSNPFWMGRTEVTNAEYQQFVKESGYEGSGDADSDYMKHHREGSKYASSDGSCPMVYVSWKNAVAFCKWLTERERKTAGLPDDYEYRLPTEAEWEYCCRAGTNGDYAGSLDSMAWYSDNSGSKTHAVGTKSANTWGLYDMHGNVWEWCLDNCDYKSRVVTDTYRSGMSDPLCKRGSFRVFRGGSWFSSASNCRSADRAWNYPGDASGSLGFRVVLAPQF